MRPNNMLFTFLISSERSGSNLITRLLDGHSNICGPSATYLFRRLIEHYPRYGNLQHNEHWEALIKDTVALFASKMGHWNITLRAEDLLDKVESRALHALLPHIYEKEAVVSGKEQLFVIDNHVYLFSPFLDAFFDHPKIVYLVRDPRDMALSWKKSSIKRGCVIRAAETWKQDQAASLTLYRVLQSTGGIICIRYEDLIRDTPNMLASICAFMGVSFEAKMLELDNKQRTKHHAFKVSEWENVHKPVIQTNYNKYKSELSAFEIRFVEALCKDEMQAFGYKPEYERTDSIEELKQKILPLELYDKPDFQKVDVATRKKLAERVDVLNRMKKRPIKPVFTKTIN